MYVHKSMMISYNRGLYLTVSRHTYLDQFSTNTTSRLYNGASNLNAALRGDENTDIDTYRKLVLGQ